MIEVTNICDPDTAFWDTAIDGMRNAFKSNKKHDSNFCYGNVDYCWTSSDLCSACPYYKKEVNPDDENDYDDWCNYSLGDDGFPTYVLGENDLSLAKNLISGDSPSHRKFLRQLPVEMDIKAPLYFWKQLDTYKVGTTANSESTMHTLTKYPFKIEDFSTDDLDQAWGMVAHTGRELLEFYIIPFLNGLRDEYLETKDKRYWHAINKLLPQSYNQKRTWSANYEVLLTIIQQRKNHPLKEWHDLIDVWLENIPYLKEFNDVIESSLSKSKKLNKALDDLEKIVVQDSDKEAKRKALEQITGLREYSKKVEEWQ